MNILLTGGAGFIGSNIVRRLLEDGHYVRVLDNFSTGKKENVRSYIDRIEVMEGDVRDLEKVKEAMKGVDYCIHHAALPSVERSIKEPLLTTEVNIRGTLNVFTAAIDAKVRRAIYASSSSVYGGSMDKSPVSEESLPNPLSIYALSKLTGEHYGRLFFRLHNLEVVSLRYFNVFGPNQDMQSEYAAVIPKFIKAALGDEEPIIYGDGMQSRDFTYVDNVVEANILALHANHSAAGEAFNISAGSSLTIKGLWDLISEKTGKRLKPHFAPPRMGEVRHSTADISKAEKVLGYKVNVDFETGLAKTIEYFRKSV